MARYRDVEAVHPRRASEAGDPSTSEPLLQDRGDEEESDQAHQPASIMHSIFNVVNLFMGVGLLSLPYSIKLGGWLAMPALALATLLFACSGHLIVEGFKKVEGSHSYAALGYQACGELGRGAVAVCTILDMFGGCAVCLIMSCKQIEGLLLPRTAVWGLPVSQVAKISGIAAAAPTVFIRSFRQLAPVSVLGICCSLLVTLAVVLSATLDPHRDYSAPPDQDPPAHHVIGASLPRSFGIFALSMTGHSALPSFRNSMRRPGQFHIVLNTAFALMLAFNSAVAGLGYWYWGDDVSEIVMREIATKSPFARVFGIGQVMTTLIGLNAFSKVPILLLVLQDLLISSFFAKSAESQTPKLALTVKVGMFIGVALLATAAYDVLGNVMSLMGGLTSMNASVVFPSLFYLRLFWGEIGVARRAAVALLLICSVLLSIAIIEENVTDLLRRFRHATEGARPNSPLEGFDGTNSTGPNPLVGVDQQCWGEFTPWAILLS